MPKLRRQPDLSSARCRTALPLLWTQGGRTESVPDMRLHQSADHWFWYGKTGRSTSDFFSSVADITHGSGHNPCEKRVSANHSRIRAWSGRYASWYTDDHQRAGFRQC